MELEGEVNLILPFHHRPVCSDSKMSWMAFQNPHSFGWEQGTAARVCFKENADESIFSSSSTSALDSVCLPSAVSLHHPDPTQYPSAPISVISWSQNGSWPICFPPDGGEFYLVSSYYSSHMYWQYFIIIPAHHKYMWLCRASWDLGVKRHEAKSRALALGWLSAELVSMWWGGNNLPLTPSLMSLKYQKTEEKQQK